MGAAVHQRFGRLDVLVANAATLGVLSPIGHIDPPVWDDAIMLNLTANYRLIRSFDPLLRLSDASIRQAKQRIETTDQPVVRREIQHDRVVPNGRVDMPDRR